LLAGKISHFAENTFFVKEGMTVMDYDSAMGYLSISLAGNNQ
jgi:hypothetical protein